MSSKFQFSKTLSAVETLAFYKHRIETDVAHLRALALDPVDIAYGANLSFEVRPDAEGDCLNIFCKDHGLVSVNYTDAGLEVRTFAENELAPIFDQFFPLDELLDSTVVGHEQTRDTSKTG